MGWERGGPCKDAEIRLPYRTSLWFRMDNVVVVGIWVTQAVRQLRHGLEGPVFESQSQEFFSSPKLPDRSWGPLTSNSMCTFLWAKQLQSDINHSILSGIETMNVWSYTSTPPLRLYEIYGTNFPFAVLVVGHAVRRYVFRIKMDIFSPPSQSRLCLCQKTGVCSEKPSIKPLATDFFLYFSTPCI